MARLQEHYREVVRGALTERFGYRNPMRVPKLDKIVLNMGVGEATADAKKLQAAISDMTLISGQKPAVCRARKSVANFKLRQGMAIGCKVTLRGRRMYEFLDRLVNIALAARARLSRLADQELRRPRKLRARDQRADRLSRDQLRRSGRNSRAGRGDLHHGAQR